MWLSVNQCNHQTLVIMLFLFLITVFVSENVTTTITDKLDEPLVPPQFTDPVIKCGECPCVNPCTQQLPPPPPPMTLCTPQIPLITPPPPPRFVYVSGPPGNLYPTDPFNLQVYAGTSAERDGELIGLLLLLIGCVSLILY